MTFSSFVEPTLSSSSFSSSQGCKVVAPSDMMDNRIQKIKGLLNENGLRGKV